ncbi:hypothetical protein N9156_03420 [Akkermansiaceae bacterium]|nr:hypothetical protein [Akkermansiaceae bacterium]
MNEKLKEKQNEVAEKLAEIFEQDTAKTRETKELQPDKILEMLNERKFDFSTPKERPEPSLKIGSHTLATKGNIMNIQAGVKAGKSAAMDAIMAAQFCGESMEIDSFGFTAMNEHGYGLIHIDTEQSQFDADALVRRSIRRSGMTSSPSWLNSFALADLDIEVRRAGLPILIEEAKEQHGGVFAVLIDGIGDLITDPNDSDQSFRLVDELHQLAIKNDCVIITALHENPNSDFGKTRGHLGSQLSRKAETNLRLIKDADGITTIFTTNSRHCHIPRDQGFCFHWCDDKQMHVGFGDAQELKAKARRKKFVDEVLQIALKNQGKYTKSQLKDVVMKHRVIKERAAGNYIRKLEEEGGLVSHPRERFSFNFDME